MASVREAPVIMTLAQQELTAMVGAQLDALLPDGKRHRTGEAITLALERVEYCFERIALPGYTHGREALFNHLHGDQSAVFLYYAANSAWRDLEDEELAAKFFLLNKMRNGLVCMYDTCLPEVVLLNHTVGTVLGKATYGNFLVVYQNVTVGTDRGCRPTLGEGVVIYGGSTIIGETTIGDRVAIGAGSLIADSRVPSDCVIAGRHPDAIVKPRKRDFVGHYFKR